MNKNGPEPSLPSVDLSNKQLFWVGYIFIAALSFLFKVSFAQTWCIIMPPKALEALLTDVHAPSEFRVKVRKKLKLLIEFQGSVSNMESFAQDFNCPKGSAMNPEKKCRVNGILEKVISSILQVW